MAGNGNFVDNFQKDHTELLALVTSFREAVKSSDRDGAKEILDKMNDIANSHFNFEETYLYPRLRRLMSELTKSLLGEQQAMTEFIMKSRKILINKAVGKKELKELLDTVPRLSKFLKECDDLVLLAGKFNKEDEDYLNRRLREFQGDENIGKRR